MEVLRQIQEECLTCRICQSPFLTPKALPCLHTFCKQCLADFIFSRSYDQAGKFPCPLCRREIIISERVVENFPDNHLIVSLQDLLGGSEDSCVQTPAETMETTSGQSLYPVLPQDELMDLRTCKEELPDTPHVVQPPGSQGQEENRPGSSSRLPTRPVRPPPPQRNSGSAVAGYSTGSGRSKLPSQGTTAAMEARETQRNQTDPAANGATAACRSRSHVAAGAPLQPRNPRPPIPPTRPLLQRRLVLANDAYPVPVQVNVYGADVAWGKFGEELTDFHRPVGLAVSPEGFVVVSDEKGNRIFVFEPSGKLNAMFTCQGQIHDLAVTKHGHILLANSDAAQSLVLAFNLRGEKLATFGNFFTFEKPFGVCCKSKGQIVVSSIETHLIYTLSGLDGKMTHKFTGKGKDQKKLSYPYHVSTNSKDHIIVSDFGNDCIKTFDMVGNCKVQCGKTGFKVGQLRGPRGLCTDKMDNILVADSQNRRVQVFQAKGTFLRVAMEMNKEGADVGAVPVNVALSQCNNKLFVLLAGGSYAQVRVYPYRMQKGRYSY